MPAYSKPRAYILLPASKSNKKAHEQGGTEAREQEAKGKRKNVKRERGKGKRKKGDPLPPGVFCKC